MINEANEPSSACRLWRTYKVETSTPPLRNSLIIAPKRPRVKHPRFTDSIQPQRIGQRRDGRQQGLAKRRKDAKV
jgi:hypothetical protein